MRKTWMATLLTAGILWAPLAVAQTATAPVTATCKDGTDFSGKTRSGACRGHGGVQAFTSPAASSPATSPATSPKPNSVPAPTTTAQPQAVTPRTTTTKAAAAAPGQVWVNTNSKVYHCPGTRYFGKTKAGVYMTEAAAKAEGDRPDHNKTCFPQ